MPHAQQTVLLFTTPLFPRDPYIVFRGNWKNQSKLDGSRATLGFDNKVGTVLGPNGCACLRERRLPNRGIWSDVMGIESDIDSWKTVRERRTVTPETVKEWWTVTSWNSQGKYCYTWNSQGKVNRMRL